MISKPKQLAAFVGVLASSAIMLKFFPAPFIWIFLAWGGALFAWGIWHRQTRTGIVVYNFAFALFVLAAFESWLTISDSGYTSIKKTYAEEYHEKHPYLGSRPKKPIVEHVTAYYGDRLIYEVDYSIADNGLRVAPPVELDDVEGCVLFFGGSFVYGEGVSDVETLPYQVGVQSGGRYSTYNFGFHAHGPSQMLSALEHGYVESTVECNPTHVIYLAIRDHMKRVAGVGDRSNNRPKYVRDGNGGVVYAGLYIDPAIAHDGWLTRVVEPRVRKSKLASRMLDFSLPTGEEELELFSAIVRQAGGTVKAKYPGSEFHILLWGGCWADRDLCTDAVHRFSDWTDNVHMVSEILPQFGINRDLYRLDEHDGHPNPLAHRLLAQYVLEEILDN